MSEVKQGHPKGLYVLFVTEMWERFSYYGMRAIFTLYMTQALLFDKSLSSKIYGNYTGLVYLTPLLGGYIADRYWGNRKSIFVGGVLMAIGQFIMFLSGMFFTELTLAPLLMYTGLAFLIFGNGFFKPNISTMVGQLYSPGDKRVDAAFTIFYMGINLGAFIAPLVCGGLGETGNPADFKWGFLAASIGMVISIITFELLKNKYIVTPEGVAVGAKPKPIVKVVTESAGSTMNAKKLSLWVFFSLLLFVFFKAYLALDLVGAFIYAACIIAPASIITDKSLTQIEKQRIWVIYILSFFVIFFWSAFEQAGASLTFFAEEQTDRSLFGKIVPASYFQSINAVAIVIFAPIFALMWTKLGNRNMEPASPFKQAIGLFLLALGYLIIAVGVKDLDPSVKVSMMWLVTLYSVHTFGELCLSPIGLSMVVKLAPLRFASLLMGVWFLSTATANKFAGDLSALYPEEVRIEKNLPAGMLAIGTDSLAAAPVAIDSNYVMSRAASNTVWEVTLKSDKEPKAAELSFFDKMKNNFFGTVISKKDSVLEIKELPASSALAISDFKLKQIIPSDAKFHYEKHFSKDGTMLYVVKVQKKSKTFEAWNLNPEKPSFMGRKINNLYDFFMIFVIMAGSASVVLFVLSKKLLKMMGGLR